MFFDNEYIVFIFFHKTSFHGPSIWAVLPLNLIYEVNKGNFDIPQNFSQDMSKYAPLLHQRSSQADILFSARMILDDTRIAVSDTTCGSSPPLQPSPTHVESALLFAVPARLHVLQRLS